MTYLLLSLVLSGNLSLAADALPCADADKIYKVCANQEDAYTAALAKAKTEKKKLLVVVGAEWCPWCVSLHKMLGDPASLQKGFAKKYNTVDIALYQAKQKLPTGIAVQEKLKTAAGFNGKLEGIPVLALVDPKTGKAQLIETEPLEKNTETSKGHDHKKVLAAITKAEEALK